MTLLDGPVASDVVDDRSGRVLALLADAGIDVSPALVAQLEHLHFRGKRYLVIDAEDVYPVETELAVLGATRDAEGMLRIVCLGAIS